MPSPVFFFLSLRLEDTRCKHSSTQRHTPHTIFLAFKGWEYSQLCWKLNSLKPPIPPQQFIVGEFSVFGERLELSRGWCQRAPIVPCSAAVSPPLRLHSTFPSSPDIHLMTGGVGASGTCAFVSTYFYRICLTCLISGWCIQQHRRVWITMCLCTKTRPGTGPWAHVAECTYLSSSPAPSPWLLGDRMNCVGGKWKLFGIALSQNHSVILYHFPLRKLTHDLWSKMWFLLSNTIGSAKKKCCQRDKKKMASPEEDVMKERQLSLSTKVWQSYWWDKQTEHEVCIRYLVIHTLGSTSIHPCLTFHLICCLTTWILKEILVDLYFLFTQHIYPLKIFIGKKQTRRPK